MGSINTLKSLMINSSARNNPPDCSAIIFVSNYGFIHRHDDDDMKDGIGSSKVKIGFTGKVEGTSGAKI
jgi:hypothetical protein